MSITVLLPENPYSGPLRAMLEPMLPEGSVIRRPEDGMENLENRRLLFAVALDPSGCNLAYYGMLQALRGCDTLLRGSVAGVIVTGVGEFYTKDVARDMVLALHASQRSASNTLALWELVKAALPPEVSVEEVGLRNGAVPDCNGCSYTACLHFGEQGSCFYGGPMVEEVYPAVRRCDALVMLCANYNDALSANLTACVNRLTALFRQTRFYDKRLFGLVVSGYSGGDLLARQLISALNMNKSFFLPPHFCLLETANERGSLIRLPGIRNTAAAFAKEMMQ